MFRTILIHSLPLLSALAVLTLMTSNISDVDLSLEKILLLSEKTKPDLVPPLAPTDLNAVCRTKLLNPAPKISLQLISATSKNSGQEIFLTSPCWSDIDPGILARPSSANPDPGIFLRR